jgi:xylan 1,4-beta-xylosidase
MTTATNPILPGFHPDPSICRVGADYYLVTSTFEWHPGVRLLHSRDLVNWRALPGPLTRPSQIDLEGVMDSGGVWAPCLSHAHGLFWLVYTRVLHTGGAFKDTPNFVVTAPTAEGPWSEPVFLNASGFDPSFFHDEDGRTWLVNMRWDHRPGRNRFNGIMLQEYSRSSARLIGESVRISSGSALGCTEGPHLLRRDGWYWLILAEGGTGPNHAVHIARSRSLTGPYAFDPDGPMLTSRDAWESPLQKAGHASFVDTPAGDTYLVHLVARPDRPLGRCMLGRETALQRVAWPSGAWPRLAHGGNRPALQVEVGLPAHPWPAVPETTEFRASALSEDFSSLRRPIQPEWCRTGDGLTLVGGSGPTARFGQARIARRLQHHACRAETCVEFAAADFQAFAGLSAFYDCDLWMMIALTHDETLGAAVLLSWCDAGRYGSEAPVAVPAGRAVRLRFVIAQGVIRFAYALGEGGWTPLGEGRDAGQLSDENCGGGSNFTGTWASLSCHDLSGRAASARFTSFTYAGV